MVGAAEVENGDAVWFDSDFDRRIFAVITVIDQLELSRAMMLNGWQGLRPNINRERISDW